LGLFSVAATKLGNPPLDRLIRPQHQGEGGIQHEGNLIDDGAERGIGREPQDEVGRDITHMVAAKGDARPVLAIIIGRTQANTDPGAARDGSNLPYQHDRMEEAVKLLEAGSEVSDLDRTATGVVEPGDQDRGVDEVVLLGTGYIKQVDGIEAKIIGPIAGPEQ
jgi:hypothetical protein